MNNKLCLILKFQGYKKKEVPGVGFDPTSSSIMIRNCIIIAVSSYVVIKNKLCAHRGARTHDHKVKSLALYQLS